MEKFLGMKENELDRRSCRGQNENIGGQLASISNNYWGENFIRTNETGFTALPGEKEKLGVGLIDIIIIISIKLQHFGLVLNMMKYLPLTEQL
jgi:hypothetical protein